MPIRIGGRLPVATLRMMTDDGPVNVTSPEVFDGKTVALFAVPGAFTPTCHAKHLPGYLDKIDVLKAKGVDMVACVAVNDVFVLDAWAKHAGAQGRIVFLADGNGEFTRGVGLEADRTATVMGMRSHRYSMLVKDGMVMALNVEDAPGKVEASSAEELLKALQRSDPVAEANP